MFVLPGHYDHAVPDGGTMQTVLRVKHEIDSPEAGAAPRASGRVRDAFGWRWRNGRGGASVTDWRSRPADA